jgi:iron complex outermembrane recepter protein
MSNIIMKRALLASTAFAGAAGLAATPVFAQSAQPVEAQPDIIESPTTGAIVVTGSRIARPNLEQSSPVSVVDAQEISLSQPVSAEEFLRDLPGTTPSIGPAVNNGSDGSARVNLRGLGSNRNLVLLNERRVTPRGTDGVADLNIIPVALIERVDVFTGGASTVYGADAVAGVVNFITRRDFAGIDMQANFGITERGDGATIRVDLTTGANFDDGRGNAVFSVNYSKTDPVLQGARDIGTFSRQSTRCSAFQRTIGCTAFNDTTQGFPQGSATAVPATIFFPTLFPVGARAEGGAFVPGNADYNFQPINVFITPLERWSLFGQARYEISPAIEVYTEGFYVNTNVLQQIAPAGIFGNTLQVPLNNQFLTPTMRQQLCTATNIANCGAAIAAGQEITMQVGRRFVEAGPRLNEFQTHVFQATAGARGPLTPTLNWDISGQYGESSRKDSRTGWGLLSRAQQAVRGCPAGSAAGCVPLNLFGPAGSITPQMIAFLDVPTFNFVETQFATAQAIVSGDIGWASPLAVEPVGIALGLEYRRYAAQSAGDATSRIPGEVLGSGAAALPISGEYDSREAFAELVVPLIEDRPFFHNLTLEAGARYADYSTSGGNWTYKVGASWMPVRDLKIRGVYARAVRAPNIGELFQPQVTALTSRPNDPCQGTVAEIAARGGNFQQLCLAQLALVGAPAGLLGSIAPPIAGQIQSTQGGNPNLDPEKARTITAGVVITPTFLPGAALTFDYWNIKVTDAISQPSQSDVIDGCFQATPNPAMCSIIFRNPLTGSLSGPADTTFGPVLTLSNLGTILVDGFDLGASYRRDLGFARLNWSFNGTYNRRSEFQATPLSINRECVGYYSVSCGIPTPEYQWNMRTTLSFAETDVSLLWRHLKSVEVEPFIAAADRPPIGTPTNIGPTNIVDAYQRIPAYNYFDLAVQHAISDNMRMTVTVANLFDKDPPDVGNTIAGPAANSGNTFPTVYDALGRRYVVGVNLRF